MHIISADQVGKLTVFNIGGNRVRSVAAIHYNCRRVYIRAVLTHAEYDGRGRSETAMMDADVATVAVHWRELAKTVFVPHTEAEYRKLTALLGRLIDEAGEDETYPLASLMELVGVLIERYEDEHVPELSGEGGG